MLYDTGRRSPATRLPSVETDELLRVLPVVPWTLAAVATVLLVALGVPPGGPRVPDLAAGPSPVARALPAAVAVVLAALAVLALRTGPDDAVSNPVPALVVGLGWPLLLALPPLLGPLARRLLPRPADAPHDVRPAVLTVLAVVAVLTVPGDPARPLLVATAVAAYVLVLVAVAVAFGRRTAGRVEGLGLLARWGALGPGLARWAPPRGATAVLAVVLGGAWFERYERSSAWTAAPAASTDVVVGLALALAAAAGGAAVLARAVPGGAAAVLLPLAFATAVAGVVRRALISAQLLADRVLPGQAVLQPDPLGVAGGQLLALGLVALGGALSAAVLARRLGEGAERLAGVGVLLVLTAVSAAVVLQP